MLTAVVSAAGTDICMDYLWGRQPARHAGAMSV
jgi:hypothetical protein